MLAGYSWSTGTVLFRWDINIRESTFLGLVGAGGVGMLLDTNVNALNWPRVAVILIATLSAAFAYASPGGKNMAVSESVRLFWQANDRVNHNLLQHLTQEMMSAGTPGGGMTVAEHLAELAGTTEYWVSELGEQYLRPTPRLYEISEEGDVIAETDLNLFRERFQVTRDAILEAANAVAAGETGEAPHTSADAVLLHMVAHDSHHRGQLLLALKTNGFGLPPEGAMWLPWRNEPWPEAGTQ